MRKSIRAALLRMRRALDAGVRELRVRRVHAPKLVVSSLTPQAAGSGGAVRVGVAVANTDDPTAQGADLHPGRVPDRAPRLRARSSAT